LQSVIPKSYFVQVIIVVYILKLLDFPGNTMLHEFKRSMRTGKRITGRRKNLSTQFV